MPQRSYLIKFLTTIFFGLVVSVWASERLTDFRKNPIDFSQLESTERILINGLTRQQIGEIKIGYSESGQRPDIGLFGNHQVQLWSKTSFKKAGFDGSFFNFWFANLAIPDLLAYLEWLESGNSLPRQAIIVQITTPNNDNGAFIAGSSKELPLYVLNEIDQRLLIIRKVDLAYKWVQKTFDYSTVLLGLSGNGTNGRIIDLNSCQTNTRETFLPRFMPSMIAKSLGLVGVKMACEPSFLKGSMTNDGSLASEGLPNIAVLNQNPLDQSKLALKLSDVDKVQKNLNSIIDLAARNQLALAIIVPPVYETERYSPANTIFDKILNQIDASVIVDHRRLYLDLDFFINFDHPSSKYFDLATVEVLKSISKKSKGLSQ